MVAGVDAASTCALEDDYYISLSLITFCVFFFVVAERGLLHLGWLVLPGHVGAEVANADEVLARRSGSVQLQREDLVGVPGSGVGQVEELGASYRFPGASSRASSRASLSEPDWSVSGLGGLGCGVSCLYDQAYKLDNLL